MRRTLRWVLLGTTLLAGLAFASPASAEDFVFSGGPDPDCEFAYHYWRRL